MQKRAASRRFSAWVLGDDGDPERAHTLLEVLDLHRIEYSALGETVRAGGHEFRPGSAWVIPAKQRQFGLLEAIMEQRTEFEDNTFYDVSAWTLPLAWGLPYATVSRMPDTADAPAASSGLTPDPDARAWLIPWGQLGAPALLQDLLEAGARVRAARKPFSAGSGSAPTAFQRGTLLVHAGIQDEDRLETIRERLSEAALNGLQVTSIESSMTPIGPDFGASHFTHIAPVKPLILGGKGVSAYDAGATWHLLDDRLGIAVPLVEQHDFDRLDLGQYTHILLPDGRYPDLDEADSRRIARWLEDGGILVASGRAATWAEQLCFGKQCAKEEKSKAEEAAAPRAYSDFSDDRARLIIGGAITATIADLSHPLCYGIQRPELPVFRQGSILLKPGDDAYSTPVRYSNDPLLAGFIGEQRLNEMRGQPAVAADRHGKGLLVRFANTPLFRGFWRGTERLYINALYMGQTVQDTTLPDVTVPGRNEPERL
jgi:hypothetical protein